MNEKDSALIEKDPSLNENHRRWMKKNQRWKNFYQRSMIFYHLPGTRPHIVSHLREYSQNGEVCR
jgi:hypothetical protein